MQLVRERETPKTDKRQGLRRPCFSTVPSPAPLPAASQLGSVGGNPAEAVFFNGPEVCVPKDCLLMMTHPCVGGRSAGRVRGTGGPLRRRWTAGGGPVAGFFPPTPPPPPFLGPGITMTLLPKGWWWRGGIADVLLPVTARSLLVG